MVAKPNNDQNQSGFLDLKKPRVIHDGLISAPAITLPQSFEHVLDCRKGAVKVRGSSKAGGDLPGVCGSNQTDPSNGMDSEFRETRPTGPPKTLSQSKVDSIELSRNQDKISCMSIGSSEELERAGKLNIGSEITHTVSDFPRINFAAIEERISTLVAESEAQAEKSRIAEANVDSLLRELGPLEEQIEKLRSRNAMYGNLIAMEDSEDPLRQAIEKRFQEGKEQLAVLEAKLATLTSKVASARKLHQESTGQGERYIVFLRVYSQAGEGGTAEADSREQEAAIRILENIRRRWRPCEELLPCLPAPSIKQ
jgi:hypothetical protein